MADLTPRQRAGLGIGAGAGVAGAVIAAVVAVLGNFEGLRTHAYKDSVGVSTVCYGETAGVKMGDTYTVIQCKEMLAKSLTKYIDAVKRCVKVPMPLHRQVAIISFTYNVGGGTMCKSGVVRELNKGNVQRACDNLLLYNRGGGRVLKGLTIRRQAERVLCLRSD